MVPRVALGSPENDRRGRGEGHRGSIRDTYLFDTRGDHTPGGDFLDLIEERVSGPHPRFSMSDEEFCGVVTPLLA